MYTVRHRFTLHYNDKKKIRLAIKLPESTSYLALITKIHYRGVAQQINRHAAVLKEKLSTVQVGP